MGTFCANSLFLQPKTQTSLDNDATFLEIFVHLVTQVQLLNLRFFVQLSQRFQKRSFSTLILANKRGDVAHSYGPRIVYTFESLNTEFAKTHSNRNVTLFQGYVKPGSPTLGREPPADLRFVDVPPTSHAISPRYYPDLQKPLDNRYTDMVTSVMLARQITLPSHPNQANSFPDILLQTLCRSEKSQLLWNQANPNSFAKTLAVGVPVSQSLEHPLVPSPFPPITSLQPLQFHAITHSFAQRRSAIPSVLNSLRSLSIAMGVYTFLSLPSWFSQWLGASVAIPIVRFNLGRL